MMTMMAQTMMAALRVEMRAGLMPVETLPLTEVEMPPPLVVRMLLGTLQLRLVAPTPLPMLQRRPRHFVPDACCRGLACLPLALAIRSFPLSVDS